MNPQLLKVIPHPNHSFSIRQDVVPYFYNRWHFHPEVELLHIEKGSGIQFMGDQISRFKKGDVVLVGANLPHYWRCDEAYFKGNDKLRAVSTVAHFREDFWGQAFLDLPENKKIRDLLVRARRGISIGGTTRKEVADIMAAMLQATEAERLILLLTALHKIAGSRHARTISSTGFQPAANTEETERINKIYTYSITNFKSKISLDDIARIANISPHSFCRYFNAHTRKTYNYFLQELRVGHASKLLIENKLSITQVCYESGFNNVTNFYKAFRKITGKTPLEYQKAYHNGQVE